MNNIKNDKRKYKNPPIVEALCEIFFNGSQWDSTIPGLFFEKIRDTYPKKRELEQIGVEVSISKDIQGSKVMRGGRRIQFLKEDGSQLVQIERDLLVVNQLRPYPRFEDWKPIIGKMLNFYYEIAHPEGVRQIGIKYINRIVIPKSTFKMEDYFYLYPQVPQSLGEKHGKFMMRLEIPPTNQGHLLIVTFGTAPAKASEKTVEVLDIYDIYNKSGLLTLNEIEKYIIEAHENVEMAFENSITENTRNLFHGEDVK